MVNPRNRTLRQFSKWRARDVSEQSISTPSATISTLVRFLKERQTPSRGATPYWPGLKTTRFLPERNCASMSPRKSNGREKAAEQNGNRQRQANDNMARRAFGK